jgi:hypothetical protein
MALLDKERAASPIPSTITVETSVTVADINLSKASVLEIAKPEPFYGLRQKFKAVCTQVRLNI